MTDTIDSTMAAVEPEPAVMEPVPGQALARKI